MSVRLRDVTFTYGASRTPALRDVSLDVAPGGVTLLTGANGAGCSTLLLVMAGLAPRVTGGELRGRVEILGVDPRDDAARTALAGRVGLLFPSPWMQLSGLAYTARAEVAFGPANLGWTRARIASTVSRAMDRVGVASLAERDPQSLSGGELQRVMFAAVLAMEPDVVLLDEPAVELDPAGAQELYAMVASLARDTTVVVATTDVDGAVEVADRVVVLENGGVVADGDPVEVLGDLERVADRTSTTVAAIARQARCAAPLPVTVMQAVRRFET